MAPLKINYNHMKRRLNILKLVNIIIMELMNLPNPSETDFKASNKDNFPDFNSIALYWGHTYEFPPMTNKFSDIGSLATCQMTQATIPSAGNVKISKGTEKLINAQIASHPGGCQNVILKAKIYFEFVAERKSSRDAYVDTAVGYVELSRSASECTLRCKVVPEHKVSAKQYMVTAIINEKEQQITQTNCDGCAAASGGCKHTLVFLFWLSKRTNEPATTSVACYWKKPILSGVRTDPISAEDIYPIKKIKLDDKDLLVLPNFLAECKKHNIKTSLATGFTSNKMTYNVFDIAVNLFHNKNITSFSEFKYEIDEVIVKDVQLIESKTKEQVNSKMWHNVRQGRITASILYEASQCKTDGTLVQRILGGYKVPETLAIKRGKKLEPLVLKELENKLGQIIEKSGFILINGLVGASPDGIGPDYTVEIKCPLSTATMKTYLENGIVKIKVRTQMQAQMLAAHKKKAVLCVADPTFEKTKKIHIQWINFDQEFIRETINNALKFWEKYIFPKIMSSAR